MDSRDMLHSMPGKMQQYLGTNGLPYLSDILAINILRSRLPRPIEATGQLGALFGQRPLSSAIFTVSVRVEPQPEYLLGLLRA